jgi:hypothetical protein
MGRKARPARNSRKEQPKRREPLNNPARSEKLNVGMIRWQGRRCFDTALS